jgi:hypothetical protein
MYRLRLSFSRFGNSSHTRDFHPNATDLVVSCGEIFEKPSQSQCAQVRSRLCHWAEKLIQKVVPQMGDFGRISIMTSKVK